jgi:hypothetical protein
MTLILGFLGSAIGRYALIALAGFALLTYARYSAKAPLQDAIVQMREAAANKEKISAADQRRANDAEARAARLNATVESVLHESKATACRLEPAELERLRGIAAGG